jgi:hypothetical protein
MHLFMLMGMATTQATRSQVLEGHGPTRMLYVPPPCYIMPIGMPIGPTMIVSAIFF